MFKTEREVLKNQIGLIETRKRQIEHSGYFSEDQIKVEHEKLDLEVIALEAKLKSVPEVTNQTIQSL